MFEHFKPFIPISDEKWQEYIGLFKRVELPAKAILIREGEISQKAYVIEKGCVRAWFNNEGKDITFQFFFENSMVSSIESFRKNIPSMVTVETIEPSTVWWIHKKDLLQIIAEIQEIAETRELFVNAIFERTFNYMNHFFSSIKDSPQIRYERLLQEKPEIIQRIPQHYIASYLGISSVHLSRIKSKIAKGK